MLCDLYTWLRGIELALETETSVATRRRLMAQRRLLKERIRELTN